MIGRLALVVIALLAVSPSFAKPVSDPDAVAVINSLLADTAKGDKPGRKCVWAELSPPLEQSRNRFRRGYSGNQLQERWYGINDKALAVGESDRLDRALKAAAGKREHSELRSIRRVPRPLTLMAGRTEPRRCRLEWESMEKYGVEYQASYTRPAFANGYAFVEEQGYVHGTNPGPVLYAMRKRHGQWVQVAYQTWIGE